MAADDRVRADRDDAAPARGDPGRDERSSVFTGACSWRHATHARALRVRAVGAVDVRRDDLAAALADAPQRARRARLGGALDVARASGRAPRRPRAARCPSRRSSVGAAKLQGATRPSTVNAASAPAASQPKTPKRASLAGSLASVLVGGEERDERAVDAHVEVAARRRASRTRSRSVGPRARA